MACQNLAVPAEVMAHVVNVESSRNPYAIGVVGGQLVRQPQNLGEAVATVRMLEERGYNFSLGVAQVNRANLGKYGLDSYEKAFDYCPNVVAGSQILAQCYSSAGGDWGKAFSCYYSGNFTTGYQDGYVQKIFDSMARSAPAQGGALPIQLVSTQATGPKGAAIVTNDSSAYRVAMRSVADAAINATVTPMVASAVGVQAQTYAPSPADFASGAALEPGRDPAPGRIPTDPATAAALSQVGQSYPAQTLRPGQVPVDPATAAIMSQVGVSSNATGSAPSESGGVFVPQVSGPGEAPAAAPQAVQQPAGRPGIDQADMRNGGRDGAFVF